MFLTRSSREWLRYCASHYTIIWRLACWFRREAFLESRRGRKTCLPSVRTYRMALPFWIRISYRHWKIPIWSFSFANPRTTYRRDWPSLSSLLRSKLEHCCPSFSSNFTTKLTTPVPGLMQTQESILSLLFRWSQWSNAAWFFLYPFWCLEWWWRMWFLWWVNSDWVLVLRLLQDVYPHRNYNLLCKGQTILHILHGTCKRLRHGQRNMKSPSFHLLRWSQTNQCSLLYLHNSSLRLL